MDSWKTFDSLFLIIVTASVERLFSAAGQIFRPTRTMLSDENFEKLIFLKVNTFWMKTKCKQKFNEKQM